MKVKREGAKILVCWRRNCIEDVEKAKEFYSNLTRQGWFAFYVFEKEIDKKES